MCGVMILLKHNFEYTIHNIINDDNGRYIILDITIEKYDLSLINIYGLIRILHIFLKIFINYKIFLAL